MATNPTSAWPADAVVRMATADLVPYARNARLHNEAQVAEIAASIREWGFTVPVLVDEANTVIAGHGRLLAAHKLNLPTVPAMVARGWSENQIRAYRIADNKLTLNSVWNDELLALELQALPDMTALMGFQQEELARLLAQLERTQGLTDPDDVPEVPEEPETQPGDLWICGKHRLLCGDATSAEDVARLLGEVKPNLMVTDPPYGVRLDMEWRDRAGHNEMAPASRSYMKIAMAGQGISGDTRGDWSEAFALVPSLTVAYVWHATSHLIEVGQGLESIGFDLRQQIIWVKTVAAMSRSAYHWKHEPCWYAVRKGSTAHWTGGHDQTTLWEAASPKHIMSGSKEQKFDHPTQKPIVLYQRAIENHRPIASVVYEPFCGSGTAIISCEQLNCECMAMELEPRFVDVAKTRWENFTGQVATKEQANAKSQQEPARRNGDGGEG